MSRDRLIEDKIIRTGKVNWRRFKFLQKESFKEITKKQMDKLKASILNNDFIETFKVWEANQSIQSMGVNKGDILCLDGYHRCLALSELAAEGYQVPEEFTANFVWCKNEKDAAKKVLVYSSIYASVTDEGLYEFSHDFNLNFDEIKFEIDIPKLDLDRYEAGYVRDDIPEDGGGGESLTLAERFIVPPFSVLDARQGYWQERKRNWIALGIQSELGRGSGVTWGDSAEITEPGLNYYRNQNKDNGVGKGLATGLVKHRAAEKQGYSTDYEGQEVTGTSIFDPVLTELMYRWFTPAGGAILDPFAGGSVRGIVAEYLGYKYTGIDLSERQIAANREQAERLKLNPKWVVGDSANIQTLAAGAYDFIFSCPPYYNLEVYSDAAEDLSNLKSYDDFMASYSQIINNSINMLSDNRFACFVVGDIRDKRGFYYNFVSDTIKAFVDAGMQLYNDAVLITSVGSLPIRVVRQFTSGRKLGKTHQNVLVFFKGNPRTIKTNFPELDIENCEIFRCTDNDAQIHPR